MFIKVNNVSMVFPLSLMDQVLTLGKILFARPCAPRHTARAVVALENVSLDLEEAERVGIIGSNGAGKTTLLQIMAGLSQPTSGSVEVEGRVTCVMTLGVGLREELSGRQNIYIDGEINGKSKSEMDRIVDQIIEFTDIGEFIELPVRTYSSGMKARLGFAMITFIEPEILFIDEALGAGDARFGQKASRKIRELCDKGKILVLVSHSMAAVVDMCNRCIWLEKGRIVMDGQPKEVTEAYLEHVRKLDEIRLEKAFRRRIGGASIDRDFSIPALDFLDSVGQPKLIFEVGDDVTVRIRIVAGRPIDNPDLRLCLERFDGIRLIDNIASRDGFECGPIDGEAVIEVPLGPLHLGKHKYEVKVELLDGGSGLLTTLASRTGILIIENQDYPYENPVTHQPVTWRVEEVPPGKHHS